MPERRHLFSIIILIAILTQCGQKNQLPEKPNIVLIYADDLGWSDPGYNGNPIFETPTIDKLAEGGLMLNRFYPGSALCAPSRATMLSGTFTPRHGIYIPDGESQFADTTHMRFKVPTKGASDAFNTFPVTRGNNLDPSFVSLAELLSEAGYRTARFGKWHLGEDDQGFDISSPDGKVRSGEVSRAEARAYYSDSLIAEKLTNASIDFIRDNRENPFFLFLSHWEVHLPMVAKSERVKYFEEKIEKAAIAGFDPVYAAEVEQLDISTERVIGALEEMDLMANTLIIFASDNGGVSRVTSNAPLRGGKGTFCEGGIRSPCILYWKDVIQPSSYDRPVSCVDFLPTFAALADVDPPKEQPTDGESILDLLRGDNFQRSKPVYFHFPLYVGGNKEDCILPSFDGQENFWRAVPSSIIIKDQWKLIHYYEYDQVELYNLDEDISEQVDQSQSDPERALELKNELENWLSSVNAPIPLIEN